MDFEDKRAGAHAVRAEQRLKLFIIVLPEVEQVISEAAVDLGEIIADLVETFVEARTRQGEGEVVPLGTRMKTLAPIDPMNAIKAIAARPGAGSLTVETAPDGAAY